MTRLAEALQNISEIHAHLARGEVYRGVSARPVLLSGLLGLLAAGLQAQLIPSVDAQAFVLYWLASAAVCAAVGASGAFVSYFQAEDALIKRRTRIVAGQFLPSLAAGGAVTLALLPTINQCVGLLPGLWAVLYGLGLFSTRPYLPHATGWVALYFLAAGSVLMGLLPPATIPSPWIIALVFAGGQLGLAWVLHRNAERENQHG